MIRKVSDPDASPRTIPAEGASGWDRSLQRISASPVLFVLVLLAIAALSSSRRFGARENELVTASHSDSDLYLEMSRVFVGAEPSFSLKYVNDHAHHYNRPALPFVAGWLGHGLTGGNFRSSFSLVNIMAAVVVAFLLFRVISKVAPEYEFAWVASVLFLTGFPQINWGYHILTDTCGFATAFASAILVARLLDQETTVARMIPPLLSLLLVQSLAWLTRETAMFPIVVALAYSGFRHMEGRGNWKRLAHVLMVLLLARIPLSVYSNHFNVHSISSFSTRHLFEPYYMLDMLVKSAVCFHICWIPVVYLLHKHGLRALKDTPILIRAWSVAAILYIGAGYAHNDPEVVGYPLRLTYALFPLVFYLTVRFLSETQLPRRTGVSAAAICGSLATVNFLGAFLDHGRGRITIQDLIAAIF